MSGSFYKSILENCPVGYAFHRILCDRNNKPYDYEFLEVNGMFERFTGLSGADVVGKRLTEVIPSIDKDTFQWIQIYGEIAINGTTKEFEQYSEALRRWYRVKAFSPEKHYFITYFSDITGEIEEKLIAERRFKDYFDKAPVGVFILDEKGDFLEVNDYGCNALGYTESEIIGLNFSKMFSEKNREKAKDKFAELLKTGQVNTELEYIKKSGELRYALLTAVRLNDEKNIVFSQDITDKKAAENDLRNEKELLKTTLKSIGDGVVVTDRQGVITIVNDTLECITGWRQDELVGRGFADAIQLVNERTGEICEDPVHTVLKTGNIIGLANHTAVRRRDGSLKPVADSAAPIKDGEGKTLGVVLVIRDVTEERKKREEIAYLGYHDSLTGLYNRRFFDEELNRLDKPRNLPLSIIIGDVNGLKLTNDAFGHIMGDKLLKKMAETIKRACRADDIIARWGGDEFIILLPKTSAQEADDICTRIKLLASKVKLDAINFSISVGYETKREPGEDIKMVLKKAEDYMYRKKSVESQSMRGNTIHTILTTMHEKDPNEERHSARVRDLSMRIARAMALSEKEIGDLEIIALMHDIGKIAIDDRILNKNGPLNEKEWFEIKRHPEIGYRILSASNEMGYIASCVLSHHENYDGSGYPFGLKQEYIPLLSRIISLADTYEAMTSDRPYRKAYEKDAVVREIANQSGKQFDPLIVKAFLENVIDK